MLFFIIIVLAILFFYNYKLSQKLNEVEVEEAVLSNSLNELLDKFEKFNEKKSNIVTDELDINSTVNSDSIITNEKIDNIERKISIDKNEIENMLNEMIEKKKKKKIKKKIKKKKINNKKKKKKNEREKIQNEYIEKYVELRKKINGEEMESFSIDMPNEKSVEYKKEPGAKKKFSLEKE